MVLNIFMSPPMRSYPLIQISKVVHDHDMENSCIPNDYVRNAYKKKLDTAQIHITFLLLLGHLHNSPAILLGSAVFYSTAFSTNSRVTKVGSILSFSILYGEIYVLRSVSSKET